MADWLPGTWEPKGLPVTNLFPNPELVGAGTVEVRRNLCPTPSFEATTAPAWSTSGSATAAPSTDWAASGARSMKVTAGGTNSNAGDIRIGSLTAFPAGVSAGMTVTMSATIMMPAAYAAPDNSGGSRQRRIMFFWQNGAGAVSQSYGPQAPNTPGVHKISHTLTIPADAVGLIYSVGCAGSGSEPNFITYVDEVLLERSATVRPFFAPGVPSPDPDLTPSWTGTANNSPSILTGVPIAAIPSIPGRCFAIRSSKVVDGVPFPVRLIADRASADTFVVLGTALPTDGTFLATRYQESVLSNPSARGLWVTFPESYAPLVNEVGAREYRYKYSGLTSTYQGRLYHGGAQGSGDVWYRAVGIFAGAYDGPWFSGDTPDTDEVIYAWQGPRNASPSTRQEMEAVMATIWGTLSDFGLEALTPFKPVLKFLPSGPGVKGNRLFSSRPVEAPVNATGAFSVLLEPTDGVIPKAWYTVSIEYLNPGGEYTSYDLLNYRLLVPAPGGAIGELPDTPLSADTVLVSLAPPPPGYKGWYLNAPGPGQDPGDPNDPASSGTGILEIVS
ncbi:hypothetical protein [Microbacterium sp.]|uniref:hypothetical protein n=1 Tax=Microbacterium sp. TaxID=51671 RepID=UPI002810DCC3|nr:hypothetical protein [Microbacterium sp.]